MPEKAELPDKIFCGRKCKFVIAKDGKTYYMGESVESELPNDSNQTSLAEFKLTKDESNTEKIVEVACGIWYNLYVTDQGKLWASGRKFLKRVGIDSKDITEINMPNTSDGPLSVLRAWASNVKEE
jgi:alpha-tubulin suppressor-like RCC1 family protein